MWLRFSVCFAAYFACLSAHADTTVTIVPRTLENAPPLVLDPQQLAAIPPQQWNTQTAEMARQWTAKAGVNDNSDSPSDGTSQLVIQLINFVHDISNQTESFESDFHAQFMHAISKQAPGFAWVLEAEQVGFDTGFLSGSREGGGIGVQIPLLGTKNLWVKDGEQQLVLRLLPIAGNDEEIHVGQYLNRFTAPGSGIVVRPSAELEASFQRQGLKPGVRILVQPRITNPTEARMLAELYLDFNVNVGSALIKSVTISPRCVLDFSTDHGDFEDADTGSVAPTILIGDYEAAYRKLNRLELCTVSAQFALGL